MIATRVSPDRQLVVVGAPEYFERNSIPETPHDLTKHGCINIRHRPSVAIYAWEFEKDGQALTVKAEGSLVFNSMPHVINAAVDGTGLAYVTEELAAPYVADGRLKAILGDWCPYFSGFHLYYPNRRQASMPPFLLSEYKKGGSRFMREPTMKSRTPFYLI